jgi:plasmid stabilization system protein ParE
MEHEVRITRRAYDQIDEIVEYINSKNAPQAARRWRDRILEEFESLRRFPLRHGLAPEAQTVGLTLHQMMFGRYRVLYTVDSDLVVVHGVRHGARRPLRSDELPGETDS